MGTDASNISRIERGETEKPTVRLLKRIADVLELDFAHMLLYLGIEIEPRPYSLADYLRLERGLPEEAIAEVEAAIAQIEAKYRHRLGRKTPNA